MKKVFVTLLSLTMVMSLLAGCGSNEAATDDTASEDNQDAQTELSGSVSTNGSTSMESVIGALGEQFMMDNQGVTVTYENFNGQNDSTVLNQIGSQIVSGGYDAIIPIGTLAAQCMANAADGSIPVIYAAISDPETAGLTGLDNVTGTSDALNTDSIMNMIFAANPNVQTVGLLYSNSEPNSTTPIANAKAYLDSKGIKYVEKTGNTADEVLSAANALAAAKVDAVFTPTDNTIMNSAAAVGEIFAEAGIPHYTGADSFVTAGCFATCGVNYTDLGTYTADMALEILQGGAVPTFHVMDGGIITVNKETAQKLGIDPSVFSSLAGQVVEVDTAA